MMPSRPAGFAARDELPHSLPAEPVRSVDDELAPEENLLHAADGFPALEHAVVDAAVPLGGADGPALVWIEQDKIGVGADGDGALARKQAEQLGRRRRQQLHQAVQRHAAFADGTVIEQRQAGLDAWRAVRNLAEIVPALLL